MRARTYAAVATTVSIVGTVLLAPPALAAPPTGLAEAITADPDLVVGAELVLDPSAGRPAEESSSTVATAAVAGFPRQPGGDYAVLSTGIARDLFGESQGDPEGASPGTDFGGTSRSGAGTDFDVTVLRVDLQVPAGVNCLLGVDLRFLSEEFPEFVGQEFNDAFIAEVGESTWTVGADSSISAPDNFAFDPEGNVLSINAGGGTGEDAVASMTAEAAAGTTFDGASPLVTAATPLQPGLQSLFFTVFDQGDGGFDSAVMIDDLRVGTVADPATECRPGVRTVRTTVTATAPTFTDLAGTADDTYTVPDVDGVTYAVGGQAVGAGTYPATGTVVVTATAEDGYQLSGETEFSHTFSQETPAAPVIGSGPVPSATVGTPFTHTFTATGSPAPQWSVTAGELPAGLTLDPATGVLSGTPTGPAGTAVFTVTATNDVGDADREVTLTVGPGTVTPVAPEVTSPGTLPAITVGAPFRHVFTATGAPAPRWSVTAGRLPAGLTLDPATGVLSGTPTGPAGTAAFTVGATNDLGSDTLVVSAPVLAAPAAAPGVQRIDAGNRTLTVTLTPPAFDGGSPVRAYEYSLDGGRSWTRSPARVRSSPLVISGLDNGVEYPVSVRAVTDAGPGAASPVVTGTPRVAPVSVAVPGQDQPRVPELPPGSTALWVDGAPQPVQAGPEDRAWVVRGQDFSVSLRAFEDSGSATPVDAQGRLVVRTGGRVTVQGDGFAPGTEVDVWLFSTPTLLGTVPVGADGTFSASLPLPAGIPAGEHTAQLNGLAADGSLRTLATGLVVEMAPATAAAPVATSATPATGTSTTGTATTGTATTAAPDAGELAWTGTNAAVVAGLAALLLVAGGGLLVLSRRRSRPEA